MDSILFKKFEQVKCYGISLLWSFIILDLERLKES
jgi:hypothetical protein